MYSDYVVKSLLKCLHYLKGNILALLLQIKSRNQNYPPHPHITSNKPMKQDNRQRLRTCLPVADAADSLGLPRHCLSYLPTLC